MFRRIFLPVCILVILLLTSPFWTYAATPTGCPTGAPIANLKLLVFSPPAGGSPLPINGINIVGPGSKLRYEPVNIPKDLQKQARVSVILVPVSDNGKKHFEVLPAKPVKDPAEWPIPARVSAIGIVFGPDGIDTKKVASLVEKHPEIVTKIADYAEQSTRVEGLVQALSGYEQEASNGKSLQSVLDRYSSEYGVKMPAVSDKTSSSEQTLQLLHAVAPEVASNDPIALQTNSSKAGSLAGSVAVSYFGLPLALGIGGVSLAEALHSSLFPATTFRSAFGSPTESGGMNLCTAKAPDSKNRTRINYLWISRVPNDEAPVLSIAGNANIAAGAASSIKITAATAGDLEKLARIREWQLSSAANKTPISITVQNGTPKGTLTLDLNHAKLSAGQYQLAAKWDWEPIQVKGIVNVHELGNPAHASVAVDSQDALVAGAGSVKVQLTGTDFEFVDSVSLLQDGNSKKLSLLPLKLPKGEGQGEQLAMNAQIDTSALAPGRYALAIGQVGGSTGDVPITIHPPNPELTELPLHVNTGEPQQVLTLHGKNLERIEKIVSPGAEWTLSEIAKGSTALTERRATIKLDPAVKQGARLNAEMGVTDLQQPLKVDDVLSILGPRPKITGVTRSLASQPDVALRDGEIPAGAAVSFSLQVEHINSRPVVSVACSNDNDTRRKVMLAPGDQAGIGELDITGPSSLFLSIDPGIVGDSGCQLVAQVTRKETGTSDAYVLGGVIRLPHISKFDVGDEKVDDFSYSATLTGQDLQLIDKTGWSPSTGEGVRSIPTSVPGSPQEQNLKVVVPWPPPSPKAPLYIWLRGEDQARQTTARY